MKIQDGKAVETGTDALGNEYVTQIYTKEDALSKLAYLKRQQQALIDNKTAIDAQVADAENTCKTLGYE